MFSVAFVAYEEEEEEEGLDRITPLLLLSSRMCLCAVSSLLDPSALLLHAFCQSSFAPYGAD
jgi:hypothetical protein